jgi:hypothetical protein
LLNGASFNPLDIKEEGLSGLAGCLMRTEITIHFSVPSVFRAFVGTLTGGGRFPNLRLLTLEGELAAKRDVQLYKDLFSDDCILVNRLGCRETGGFRQYFIDKKTEIRGNEAGFNQIGEIAVRSRYLRLGYWQKPELTKAKFLSDPTSGDERIYLTGDLGRMLPDGCLEYLGRKDFQVKIRGFQVELNKVEELLLGLSTIKEAVVVARQDYGDDTRVVAYVVPNPQPPPDVSSLRRVLAEKLPDYMVPSAFVVMDRLPLLPNGKVDRRGLPAPDRRRPELEVPFVSPRNPVETALAAIWAEVLGLGPVGIHDNFLDLGGHSLLATRIISRVINTCNVEVPVALLLESPTVADMALVISESQSAVQKKDLARILNEVEALTDDDAQRFVAEVKERHE